MLMISLHVPYIISTCMSFIVCNVIYNTSHKNNCPQNEVALSYCRVRGLYFLADIFATTIIFNKPYMELKFTCTTTLMAQGRGIGSIARLRVGDCEVQSYIYSEVQGTPLNLITR